MKRMLINATHREAEVRIAIVDGQEVVDIAIASTNRQDTKANIYMAVVTRIEVGLEAAFVNYGGGRHGFLPLKEVARNCYRKEFPESGRRPNIHDVLEVGQEILIQIEKEERGNKGAAITTYISLAGRFLVLMPNNSRAGGVSRRIDGDERDELHHVLSVLKVPEGMGAIIRTAGSGRSLEELQWDLEILLRLWRVIESAAKAPGNVDPAASQKSVAHHPAPFLVYQESNIIIRTLRDHLRQDIDEIAIDQRDVYEEVMNHLKITSPDFVSRVKLYQEPTPLFTYYQIESQIESAFDREVRLKSGATIVINPTEALVAIDINSAKSNKGGDIEETALMTNLEAAKEIAWQIRLRDIGGLIVIDFIDMKSINNQQEVEKCLREALDIDRARIQVGHISRFGLLEMSRQRLRPSLGEFSRIPCPRCQGQGMIRGIESLSLAIIRIIEEEALKANTAQVRAIVPIEIATYILNEKRQGVIDIEKRQNIQIIVVPNVHLQTPKYEIERIKSSDISERTDETASYKLTVKPNSTPTLSNFTPKAIQQPLVKNITINELHNSAPSASFTPELSANKDQPGLLKKIFTSLFDKKEDDNLLKGQIADANIAKPTTYSRPRSHYHNQRRKNINNRLHNKNRPRRDHRLPLKTAPTATNASLAPIPINKEKNQSHEVQAEPVNKLSPPQNIEKIIEKSKASTPSLSNTIPLVITNLPAPTVAAASTIINSEAKPLAVKRPRPRYRPRNRGKITSANAVKSKAPLAGEDIYSQNKDDNERN